jgi:hypothetical protein
MIEELGVYQKLIKSPVSQKQIKSILFNDKINIDNLHSLLYNVKLFDDTFIDLLSDNLHKAFYYSPMQWHIFMLYYLQEIEKSNYFPSDYVVKPEMLEIIEIHACDFQCSFLYPPQKDDVFDLKRIPSIVIHEIINKTGVFMKGISVGDFWELFSRKHYTLCVSSIILHSANKPKNIRCNVR